MLVTDRRLRLIALSEDVEALSGLEKARDVNGHHSKSILIYISSCDLCFLTFPLSVHGTAHLAFFNLSWDVTGARNYDNHNYYVQRVYSI
jgi:hypothetical protein